MDAATLRDAVDAEALRSALAGILQAAFASAFSFHRDRDEAEREVEAALDGDDRRVLVAVEGDGSDASPPTPLGWIGGIAHSPHLVELHPLAVHPDAQGRGIVRALEDAARRSGATTVFLGTEDETGATSRFDRDPLPDAAAALRGLEVAPDHPIAFYRRLGDRVTGLIPHAVGPGRHDFILARRVDQPEGVDGQPDGDNDQPDGDNDQPDGDNDQPDGDNDQPDGGDASSSATTA